MGTARSTRTRTRWAALLAAFVTTVFLVMSGGVLSAHAAVLKGAITGVTTSPGKIDYGDYLRTDITFCIPDGSSAGDTFSLTYPNSYTVLPDRFPVDDQKTGVNVANVDINEGTRVITFTLNAYVESHDNVCGDAFFESKVTSQGDETLPLTFTSNDDSTFRSTVTVGPKPAVSGQGPHKVGSFPTANQCRSTTEDCLTWRLQSAVGPLTGGTITDKAGSNWSWDCATVKVEVGTPSAGFPGVTGLSDYDDASVTCNRDSLAVTFKAVPDGKLLQVRADTTAAAKGGKGGVSYPNTASFTWAGEGSEQEPGHRHLAGFGPGRWRRRRRAVRLGR